MVRNERPASIAATKRVDELARGVSHLLMKK